MSTKMNLKIEHHRKILVLFALKKFKKKKDAASALGISVKWLTKLEKQYNDEATKISDLHHQQRSA